MATATKTATPAAAKVSAFTKETVHQQLAILQPDFDKAEKAGLPVRWSAELGFATDIVTKSDNLKVCTPESLVAAMRNILHVGLTLNPIKHHCTIIPAWNKTISRFEAQFRPMYRGLIYLGTQAGVSDIVAEVVYKADSFKLSHRSDGDWFEHDVDVTQVRGREGNVFVGSYVSARMPKSGQRKLEWVPADDIYTMRAQSDSWKSDAESPLSPWTKWFDEQAKKSGINRASKRWEEDVDHTTAWQRFHTAVELEYRAEGGGRTLEHEPEPALTMEQIAHIETKAKEIPDVNLALYMGKMSAAYGVATMSEVPASKYAEILERIQVAKDKKVAEVVTSGAKTKARK